MLNIKKKAQILRFFLAYMQKKQYLCGGFDNK